jgi:prepilin-type processing-associated H-X9-DG protein
MYMDANKQKMVPYNVTWDVNGTNKTFYWPELIAPYLAPSRTVKISREDCFTCPSYPRDTGVPSLAATHYGINLDHVANSINGNPPPRAMTRYKEAATILFFADTEDSSLMRAKYDTSFSSFNAAFPRTYCPMEQAKAGSQTLATKHFAQTGGIDFRHKGRACVAYLDGHVGTITQRDVEVTPEEVAANKYLKEDIFGHNRWVK